MTAGTSHNLIISYVLLVSLAAIFGGSFMLTKIAVAEIPPATIVLVRLLVAVVFVGVVMIRLGQQ